VGLRDAREPIRAQHAPHARRVPFVHLVDAKYELHINALLTGELGQRRVLGRARAAPLLEHYRPEGYASATVRTRALMYGWIW
jgi:hypothetical protein